MTLAVMISLALLGQPAVPPETAVGPRTGTLVIDGGGHTPAAVRAFVALAGGPDAEYRADPDGHRIGAGRRRAGTRKAGVRGGRSACRT